LSSRVARGAARDAIPHCVAVKCATQFRQGERNRAMPHLALSGISKSFGATQAVAAMDLDVARGAFVALLGPSGCGKTTTLRMVAGFVAPTTGRILLDGKDITAAPVWARRFGFVFQNYALFPHKSAAENVAFGLKARRVGRAERDRRVAAALGMVGLGALAERYPAELSGGQQQRVALARALVIEPELLLLDEPLSNLDAALREEMRDEIARLQRRLGITTLFVTHDQEEALSLSDLIVVMNRGAVVEVAPPETLSERPARLFTAGFLGARTVLPGRVEGDAFVTGGGLRCALPDGAGPTASHLILRSSRLALLQPDAAVEAPLAAAARIEEVTYLGDARRCIVAAGAERIEVLVPTGAPRPEPGAPALLVGRHDAIACIAEPGGRP
jgi:putative spermidine/putrescine transport system ATP-binding protein